MGDTSVARGAFLSVLLAAAGAVGAWSQPAGRPAELSAQERQAGWRLLFDGTTTAGWRSFGQDAFPAQRWAVEDGCLRTLATAGAPARHADVVTVDRFDDFELRFDWRIAPNGNSGVKYLLDDRAIGHEYQLLDDLTNAEAKVGLHRQTAAFYDVLPRAASVRSRPAGEWNESRIVVAGSRVEHWLNGEKVLSYELDSAELRTAVAGSKFKNRAAFGTKKASPILLQDHGSEVWFRNLKVKASGPAR